MQHIQDKHIWLSLTLKLYNVDCCPTYPYTYKVCFWISQSYFCAKSISNNMCILKLSDLLIVKTIRKLLHYLFKFVTLSTALFCYRNLIIPVTTEDARVQLWFSSW